MHPLMLTQESHLVPLETLAQLSGYVLHLLKYINISLMGDSLMLYKVQRITYGKLLLYEKM